MLTRAKLTANPLRRISRHWITLVPRRARNFLCSDAPGREKAAVVDQSALIEFPPAQNDVEEYSCFSLHVLRSETNCWDYTSGRLRQPHPVPSLPHRF